MFLTGLVNKGRSAKFLTDRLPVHCGQDEIPQPCDYLHRAGGDVLDGHFEDESRRGVLQRDDDRGPFDIRIAHVKQSPDRLGRTCYRRGRRIVVGQPRQRCVEFAPSDLEVVGRRS